MKGGVRVVHRIIDNICKPKVRIAQTRKEGLLTKYEGPRDGAISHGSREEDMC